MANREALRELQTRLASRLQTAKEEGVAVSWLAVKAGGVRYIFPLAQSGEISSLAVVQPVPYAQPWFLGVINLRGSLVGLVDLAGLIAGQVDQSAAERLGRVTSDSRVITFNAALELNCAVLVDGLAGLRNIASFTGSVAPSADAPAYFGNGGSATSACSLRYYFVCHQILSIN